MAGLNSVASCNVTAILHGPKYNWSTGINMSNVDGPVHNSELCGHLLLYRIFL